MKYHTITLGDEEINLRLTSSDASKLEEKTKKSIFDLIQDTSISNICKFLQYLVRGAGNTSYSIDDAYKLFDKFADNDWAVEKILTDAILPALRVSGLLAQSDLDLILQTKEERKAQATLQTQKA